jgi:hypothetical protein
MAPHRLWKKRLPMSSAVRVDDELFDGGPPLRMQRQLGLVKPQERRIPQRVTLTILIAWVPLAALTAAQFVIFRDETAKSFFSDIAVHARFLIAAPVLILAEGDCIHRLGRVARNFLDAGFVTEKDRSCYDAAAASTRRLLNSKAVEFVTVLLAYILIGLFLHYVPPDTLPAWNQQGGGSAPRLSPAGWWHRLVSLPLLLVLILGWLWRVFLWGRFLWLMQRLELRLIPGHPDHVGGLKFVSTSMRGFRLIAFALGAIAAGSAANLALHYNASPLAFKNVAIGVVVLVVVLAAGPPTVFVKKLRKAKRRGIFHYGTLAHAVGDTFERKWLDRAPAVDESALEVGDFSATTDLYAVVANVYEMKDVPYSWRNLANLVLAALMPFVPVALMAVPLKDILEALAKLLL